jgi:glycogen(starch) synthase
MRVLFWSAGFWPQIGGVETLATMLLPALQERGYEFIVVTPNISADLTEEADYKGIRIYRVPFRTLENYTNVHRLMELRTKITELKRTYAPDLIHINSLDIGDFFHLTTIQAHACPYMVTLHADWVRASGGKNSLVEQTLRSADWVTACSAAILNVAQAAVPEIVSRSSVIYNGRETSSVKVNTLPFHPPVVLCVGRLVVEKGFDLALSAFALVKAHFPEARMVVVGDGPVRRELQQQAVALDLRSSVEFIGSVQPDVVPQIVNAASVVVVPSRWEEPFGLVALEAALMGRAVVATRGGGLPEVVVDRKTGMIVERENSRAIAEAIIYLLSHPEITEKMGRAGRSRARKIFAWPRFVDAYDKLYRKLITEEKCRSRQFGPSARLQ